MRTLLGLNLLTIIEIIKIMKKGQYLGDVAALKLTLMSEKEETNPLTTLALNQKQESFKYLNVDELSQYAPGTFGHEYDLFMKTYRLKPLNFSKRSEELYDRYPVSMRYVRLHDLIHVLLGFAPNAAGELGVYAFIAEQKYTRTLNKAAKTAQRVSELLFWKRQEMKRAAMRGSSLARGAKPLVVQPLESLLGQPIKQLRQEMIPNFHL